MALLAHALGSVGAPTGASAHQQLPRPQVTCVEGDAAQVSLKVKICAGEPLGAPAGIQLRWFQGDASDAWPRTAADGLCMAFLTQRIRGHFLAPGDCIEVPIGELIKDETGRITPGCAVPLQCGSSYAVKAYAVRTSIYKLSPASTTAYCETLACTPPGDSCTFTQGYWNNHGPVPSGNNQYTWPEPPRTAGLMLGTVPYTPAQLQSILNQPVGGNGLVSLSRQLIAAKLNVANGADPTEIAQTIADADALIGARVVPPVGTGSLSPSATSALNDALTAYNEGRTGPGHCG
jgi:hypothetical protein